jgi:hypothetical protein
MTTLRREEAKMATLRLEDERGLRFAKKKKRWIPFA